MNGQIGRPRVIRKVTKMGRDGKPKMARDRRLGITLERVKAQGTRPCKNPSCYIPDGLISNGESYAKILGPSMRRMGTNAVPEVKDYHFQCVPTEAQPLVRFFITKPPVFGYLQRSDRSSVTS